MGDTVDEDRDARHGPWYFLSKQGIRHRINDFHKTAPPFCYENPRADVLALIEPSRIRNLDVGAVPEVLAPH